MTAVLDVSDALRITTRRAWLQEQALAGNAAGDARQEDLRRIVDRDG